VLTASILSDEESGILVLYEILRREQVTGRLNAVMRKVRDGGGRRTTEDPMVRGEATAADEQESKRRLASERWPSKVSATAAKKVRPGRKEGKTLQQPVPVPPVRERIVGLCRGSGAGETRGVEEGRVTCGDAESHQLHITALL
jgi:hypothetical protein